MWCVELHVSVGSGSLAEQFVVILVLIVTSLKWRDRLSEPDVASHLQHDEMLPLLVREFGVVLLLDGEF